MARPRKNAAPPPDIIPPQPAPQDAPSTESMEERIRASTNQPDWNVREMLDTCTAGWPTRRRTCPTGSAASAMP